MKTYRPDSSPRRVMLVRLLRFCSVLLFVLGFLFPVQLSAQQLDPKMEAALAKAKESSTSYEKAPVSASTVDKVNLGVHWRLWKRVVSSGKPGLEELDALTHDAISLGYRNLPDYASAVYSTTAGKVASGELTVEDASQVYEATRKMAPELPYIDLAYAGHLFEHNTARMPAIVGNYLRGLKKGVQWLDTRLAWELKLVAMALVAFLGAVLFFLLAQLLRYFGIVAYDTARLLPAGFSSSQTVILIVALVVVPGVLLQSPLVSMLLLLAVLSIAQAVNERIVTVLIFAVLAALPLVDARMPDKLTWPDSTAQRLMHAQYIHCDEACASKLQAEWSASPQDDPLLAYTLALTSYRQGGTEQLTQATDLLANHAQWRQQMQGPAANLMGATLIAQGSPEAGIAQLERAKQPGWPSPAPAFNLMRAYQMQDNGAEAARALDQAISIDVEAVRTHLELDRRDVNSFLLVEPLPPEVFWHYHRANAPDSVSMVSLVWNALAGPKLPLERAPLLGGLGVLLTLMSISLYLKGRTSTPCPKCGMARDPEDAEKTGHHRYCLPCYHTFVSGASLDYNARVHNERVLGRRERFQDVMRRVISVVTPGAGHIQTGHAIGGFLLAFVGLFAALVVLRPMGIWRPPHELFSANWAAQQTIAWILLSVVGCFILTAAASGISPTEPKVRRRSKGDEP